MTGTFRAWEVCPSCSLLARHGIRPPRPPLSQAALEALKKTAYTVQMVGWGGTVARKMTAYGPPPPADESAFEVIRQCECGKEWGIHP